jgi:broad specificity phosphatase PhoE
MTRVYMIRHGKPAATWGDADLDPGLDADGKAQAERAADLLMALPESERPTRVWASPLRRCRETAQPFADRIGVPVDIDARFGEIPTPVGMGAEERGAWLRAAFTGDWAAIPGDRDYDVWRRTVAEAVAEQSNAAVFSHFVAINAAVSCVTGEAKVISFRPDHVSMSVFDTEGGRLTLVELGPEAATQVL